MAVMERLQALGVKTDGFGGGVCDGSSHDYDGWNISLNVNDWRSADAAIEAVDAELKRWGVGHFFGVSVRGTDCAMLTQD
jgi:hypothetical protein